MKSHGIKITSRKLKRNRSDDMPLYKPVFIRSNFNAENRLRTFVVFDTETTGLNPDTDRIVQLSAIRYVDFKPEESWNTYLNPGKKISAAAAIVNGITDEMVKDKPKISEVADDFLEFIGDSPIVGYNVEFDLGMLWCSGIDLITGREIYDVMLSAYAVLPKGTIRNRRLVTVAEALNIEFSAHDALEDSRATGEILVYICREYSGKQRKMIPMTGEDLRKQMDMTYEEQVDYLLEKYGPSKYDYFISEYNLIKNRMISRTREGLECHHIDEDIIPTLSDPDTAIQWSYKYQKKDRLVYCNLLEHLLMHIKIGRNRFYENHEEMTMDSDPHQLITHGVNMLSMQINRLYEDDGSRLQWEENCYEVIKDSYRDYIELLKDFQRYIIEHLSRLTEFEKPIYVGRSFINTETGEEGRIIKITEDEVHIEFTEQIWIYDRNEFVVNEDLAEIMDSIHTTISSVEEGEVSERIYEDSRIY